jgi:hypothetical protein
MPGRVAVKKESDEYPATDSSKLYLSLIITTFPA